MFRRRPAGRASHQPDARLVWLILPLTMLTLAAGCDTRDHPTASSSTATAKATSCGQTKTAADVPVNIQIAHGQVACATALSIMRAYANAIRHGLAPGNGGGGPLKVQGWTCEGFDTPTVLKTGDASKCVRGNTEILAVLPNPG